MARVWWLVLGIMWLVVSCGPPPSPAPPVKNPPVEQKKEKNDQKEKTSPKPENSFKHLEYVFWRRGRVRWVVRADQAYRFRSRLEMTHPRIVSRERAGLHLEARRGVYFFSRRLFFFQGKVVLHTPNKGTLYTRTLYYRPEEEKLSGDQPLLLKDRGMVLHGVGFEYDLKTGKLRIFKQSRVEFHA